MLYTFYSRFKRRNCDPRGNSLYGIYGGMAKVYIHSNQINIKSKSLKFDFELISIVGDMLVFDWLFGYRKKNFFLGTEPKGATTFRQQVAP